MESCFINVTFRMAAAFLVHSQSPNYLALPVALFSPYLCGPMRLEIEQFTKVNLDIRAAAPQESPDIVILAGHSRLQQQPRGEEITRTHFLNGMPVKTKDLQLPSFDLPAARA